MALAAEWQDLQESSLSSRLQLCCGHVQGGDFVVIINVFKVYYFKALTLLLTVFTSQQAHWTGVFYPSDSLVPVFVYEVCPAQPLYRPDSFDVSYVGTMCHCPLRILFTEWSRSGLGYSRRKGASPHSTDSPVASWPPSSP